jgi:dihydrofolate reductase
VPVTIVAAVARNGVIGVDGGLPWRLPDDLRRFKALTLGHVLVMGRKTYESIGHPLPGRATVVVTRSGQWEPGSAEVRVAAGVPEAIAGAAAVDGGVAPGFPVPIAVATAIDDEVFVVGGAQVYAAALPLTDRLELTLVDAEPEGDTAFPDVDWEDWLELRREEGDGVAYVTYERRPVASFG